MKTIPRGLKALPHGIDISAFGGIDELLAFHRLTFGDARMEDDGSGGDGGGEGDGQEGTTPPDGSEGDGDDPDKGAKSALASERAARRKLEKDLGAAQARVQELEDAGKSEEQRREDATKAMQAENTDLKASVAKKDALLLRYEVAAAKGLDLAAAARLQGESREDVEQDADQWIAKWGTGTGTSAPPADRGQGGRGDQKASSFAQGEALAKERFGSAQQ